MTYFVIFQCSGAPTRRFIIVHSCYSLAEKYYSTIITRSSSFNRRAAFVAALVESSLMPNVGSPLPLNYKERINKELPDRFYELYGVTEGFMTILDKNDAVAKSGSVGCPPPFRQVRIVDENGKEVPADTIGEICGKRSLMMPGYYNRPDLTAHAIREGWLHSGDIGYMDEDGFVYLVDRIKDMIISGGVNVYPRVIEEIASEHPVVSEVAVLGIPDEKWGESAVAAVILKKDQKETPDDLITWINERVGAKYQRICDAIIMEDFPRNSAAKTLKREIREAYLEGGKTE